MSLLFDISPTEVPDQKKPRKKRAVVADEPEAPPPAVRYVEYVILGQSDGLHECHNPKCGATFFDIIDDYKGEWLIECAFCGWMQRVPAVAGVLAPSDDFVFFDGRFIGMTLAQTASEKNGIEFIRWCSEKHKSEAVRDACTSWMAAVGYAATHRSEPCSS